MDFLFVKVAVVCSVGFGWKPKGNDVELNKVNKHGQFRESELFCRDYVVALF